MEAPNKIYTSIYKYPLSRIEQLPSDVLSLIFQEINLQKIKEVLCTPRLHQLLKNRHFKILVMQKLRKTQNYQIKEVYSFWDRGAVFRRLDIMCNCHRNDLTIKSQDNDKEISPHGIGPGFSSDNVYPFSKRVIILTWGGESYGIHLKTLRQSCLKLYKVPERGYFITAHQPIKRLLAVTDESANARIQVITDSNHLWADFDISEPNTQVMCQRLLFIKIKGRYKILGLFATDTFNRDCIKIKTGFIKIFSADDGRPVNRRDLPASYCWEERICASSKFIAFSIKIDGSNKILLIDPFTLDDKIVINVPGLSLRRIEKYFLILYDRNRFYIYDSTGICKKNFAGKYIDSDDSFVMSQTDNKIQIWDLLTGQLVREMVSESYQNYYYRMHFKAGRYFVLNEDIYHLKDNQNSSS